MPFSGFQKEVIFLLAGGFSLGPFLKIVCNFPWKRQHIC